MPALRFLARSARCAAPAALALLATGCNGGGGDGATTAAPPPTAPATTHGDVDLARAYIVPPAAARGLDYRIDWQTDVSPGRGVDLEIVQPAGEAIFTLDSGNVLTRLRADDGFRIWQLPVADPAEDIVGITYMPDRERVYLNTGGSMLVVDAVNGSPLDRHHVEKVANTRPVRHGSYLVYGSRDGQVIWYNFDIAFQWRGYQVSRTIQVAPVLEGERVVAVGADGRIMVLDASSARQVWSKKLLDAVVAPPVVGNSAVYLAGTDQYLYAFDLQTGRTLWSNLTIAPLRESPTLIDDRVYQQVPREGLLAFDAMPLNSPGGRVIWSSGACEGGVLTQRADTLLAWDRQRRIMDVLETGSGAVVRSERLPRLDLVETDAVRDGVLIAASRDGRVIRLVPR